MDIKMIVSDLDGTLLNSDQDNYEVSARLVDKIRQLKEKGKIFTIATGRPMASSLEVMRKLEIDAPCILYNGAKIVDRHGNEIFSEAFSLKNWLPFLTKLQLINATIILPYNGEVFCLKYTKAVSVYEKKEEIKCTVIDRSLLYSDLKVNKILVIGDVKRYKVYWEELEETVKDKFRYVISEDNYMEIVMNGVSKGNALKKLKYYLGIKDEEVVAIGNHMNDKELIEEAHIGVAVANAVEELKSLADFITTSEYEEGVIEVIEKFA